VNTCRREWNLWPSGQTGGAKQSRQLSAASAARTTALHPSCRPLAVCPCSAAYGLQAEYSGRQARLAACAVKSDRRTGGGATAGRCPAGHYYGSFQQRRGVWPEPLSVRVSDASRRPPAARRPAVRQAAGQVPLGSLARLQRALDAGHPTPDSRPGTTAGMPGHRRAARQPRAGSARDAGSGQVEPGHRRPVRGHPRHRQKHVSHVLGKLGAANRTEAVSRARQLGLIT
jgi:hypothetical protein